MMPNYRAKLYTYPDGKQSDKKKLKMILPVSVGLNDFDAKHLAALMDIIEHNVQSVYLVWFDFSEVLQHLVWGRTQKKAFDMVMKDRSRHLKCLNGLVSARNIGAAGIQLEMPNIDDNTWDWEQKKLQSKIQYDFIKQLFDRNIKFQSEINKIAEEYIQEVFKNKPGKGSDNPSDKIRFDANKQSYLEGAVQNILWRLAIMLQWEETGIDKEIKYVAYPISSSRGYDHIHELYCQILKEKFGNNYKPVIQYLDIRFERVLESSNLIIPSSQSEDSIVGFEDKIEEYIEMMLLAVRAWVTCYNNKKPEPKIFSEVAWGVVQGMGEYNFSHKRVEDCVQLGLLAVRTWMVYYDSTLPGPKIFGETAYWVNRTMRQCNLSSPNHRDILLDDEESSKSASSVSLKRKNKKELTADNRNLIWHQEAKLAPQSLKTEISDLDKSTNDSKTVTKEKTGVRLQKK